ncbi:MAG: ferredoxin-type protein NapF [Magnetococcales bacterium]|nr:ferredoxin-type protein NapF [Magnetococcales bacterium]NGZ27694.1 ferredoxin-type protein NapF [Magnetococcales bacterium]
MEHAVSRRHLLFGRTTPIRPPWSVAEEAFLAACNRCQDCLPACPQTILIERRGYPEVDFSRGECTFCADCVSACPKKSLAFMDQHTPPWSLQVEVGAGCLANRGIYCQGCGDACPTRAITFANQPGIPKPQLTAQRCTGCGACVSVCPVHAVKIGFQEGTRHAA